MPSRDQALLAPVLLAPLLSVAILNTGQTPEFTHAGGAVMRRMLPLQRVFFWVALAWFCLEQGLATVHACTAATLCVAALLFTSMLPGHQQGHPGHTTAHHV